MKQLLKIWERSDLLDRIVSEGQAGVPDVVRPITIAGLADKAPVTVVVVPRSRDAESLASAMEAWADPGDVAVFPAWEVVPGEALSPSLETMGRRIRIARDLKATPPKIIIASVRAVLQKMAPPPDDSLKLAKGGTADLDEIAAALVAFGYDRNYLVERPGEFSVRGGIVDVFVPDRSHPVRIDLFGDEISDLRQFSVSSQRSGAPLDELEVVACRELRPGPQVAEAAKAAAQRYRDEDRAGDLEKLAQGLVFPGMESYLSVVAGPLADLTEFLPEGARVLAADPKQCRDRGSDFLTQAHEWAGDLAEGMFGSIEEIFDRTGPVELWPYARGAGGIDLEVRGWDDFAGQVDQLAGELSRLRHQGVTIAVAAGQMAPRASEILSEAGLGLPL
ncbi:MAG: hypothetical protein ACRDIU_04490, partial [Actinomycetota bacterium]